ncbi:universal stress protein [Lentibacillus halophilus]|uniref:Universal stress protein n=1 Tax=Lentibacillus halophilus TaxID=295065 RepID=A0ABN0Z9A5_9BACI
MKRRILVAYDGSEFCQESLNEAKLQAMGDPETEVYVISVVTQAAPSTNAAVARNIEMEMAETLRPEMEKIEKDFETNDVTVYTDVVIDTTQRNAGEKICSYAHDYDIDLIIIGSRGLGNVKSMLLGSVSNRVVQLAQCPVLIIK